jgi:hypothetical protein
VVSGSLKLLSLYFPIQTRITLNDTSDTNTPTYDTTNDQYLDKLKHFAQCGKPKEAKYSIYCILNNFKRDDCEKILYDLYKDLTVEACQRNLKTFITCLVSLGHICLLLPNKVGKEIKEFMSTTIVKELLLSTSASPFNTSTSTVADQNTTSAKQKKVTKQSGKWFESDDELPFITRAKIEGIKLLTRWCLGLKSECSTILNTLKILTRIMKDNYDISIGFDSLNLTTATASSKNGYKKV